MQGRANNRVPKLLRMKVCAKNTPSHLINNPHRILRLNFKIPQFRFIENPPQNLRENFRPFPYSSTLPRPPPLQLNTVEWKQSADLKYFNTKQRYIDSSNKVKTKFSYCCSSSLYGTL